MSTALTHLNTLADQHMAEKHPNVPYRVKSKYSDKSANHIAKDFAGFLKWFTAQFLAPPFA